MSLDAPLTYTIDDTAGTFSQTAYGLLGIPGSQVLTAGVLSVGQRGLRSLGIDVNYVTNGSTFSPVIPSNAPEAGSFAVELADQTGGLVQLLGQPVAPLVAATQCPNFTTSQTYQFLTIPAPLLTAGTAGGGTSWDPTAETAYGSVDISSSGSTVTFKILISSCCPRRAERGFHCSLVRDRCLWIDFLRQCHRCPRGVGHYRSRKRPNRTRASKDRNRRKQRPSGGRR